MKATLGLTGENETSQIGYVIAISYGQDTEYWNSYLSNNDCSSKNIENAEIFATEKEAAACLEAVVKPYAYKKNWTVSFFIYEY